jgi:hypothetical protein
MGVQDPCPDSMNRSACNWTFSLAAIRKFSSLALALNLT